QHTDGGVSPGGPGAAAPLHRTTTASVTEPAPAITSASGDGTTPGGPQHVGAQQPMAPSSLQAPPEAAAPLHPTTPALGINVEPGSLGAIVRSFKAAVARRVNARRKQPGAAVWQRGYYERIVRDQAEFDAIRQYIEDNPRRWAEARDRLDHLLTRMQQQR
ncbi:MAG: hypothetical protein EOM24_24805, partial [Chloroflexia bacterium]|nr:hypothetical protein [Chloroflexia bacterium]